MKKEAYLGAYKHNWTKQELNDYLRSGIKARDNSGIIQLAERRAILENSQSIAKNLKNKGIDAQLIAESTGLLIEEIEKL